jgi:hypothetical protein
VRKVAKHSSARPALGRGRPASDWADDFDPNEIFHVDIVAAQRPMLTNACT